MTIVSWAHLGATAGGPVTTLNAAPAGHWCAAVLSSSVMNDTTRLPSWVVAICGAPAAGKALANVVSKHGGAPFLLLSAGAYTGLREPQVAPSSVETTLFTENVPRPSVVSNTHISFSAPSLKSTCKSKLSAGHVCSIA